MDNWEGRDAAATRIEDPWYDALASGWGEPGREAGATGTADPAAPGDMAVAGGTAAGAGPAGAAAAGGVAGAGGAARPTGAAAPAPTGAAGTAGTASALPVGGGAGGWPGPSDTGAQRAADVYLEVQRSPAFQEVRGRYRRFVGPAALVFLGWYLAYVVTATAAPGLMARPVVGAVNVAMVAGLGQFLTTFALTWAYTRHARVHRDRAALELRWDTQEMTREARRDR
ncbi:DUF485 domain-containing protein [Streptomyces changanensis]|uniref:DUF485 domain-containing protein n=1 Tax=Streptomyces kanasensis TaxID=936756 RepID=A0A124ECF6_9ACTN|nr:hypothetical protein ATE80_18210 [Streptomyces kanasensis]